MSERVGIYSGTFDPIHNGHIAFANGAVQAGLVDKVYFLVEPNPRRKELVSDLRHRLNMAWLVTQQNPFFEVLALDQDVFTVKETLPWLKQRFDNMTLLVGSDTARYLHTWPGYEVLKGDMDFVIGRRDGQQAVDLSAWPAKSIVETEAASVSSRAIRQSAKRAANDLPPIIRRYISTHGLYEGSVSK